MRAEADGFRRRQMAARVYWQLVGEEMSEDGFVAWYTENVAGNLSKPQRTREKQLRKTWQWSVENWAAAGGAFAPAEYEWVPAQEEMPFVVKGKRKKRLFVPRDLVLIIRYAVEYPKETGLEWGFGTPYARIKTETPRFVRDYAQIGRSRLDQAAPGRDSTPSRTGLRVGPGSSQV